jgi:hypothetical protein
MPEQWGWYIEVLPYDGAGSGVQNYGREGAGELYTGWVQGSDMEFVAEGRTG